jgi:hypothetical protein
MLRPKLTPRVIHTRYLLDSVVCNEIPVAYTEENAGHVLIKNPDVVNIVVHHFIEHRHGLLAVQHRHQGTHRERIPQQANTVSPGITDLVSSNDVVPVVPFQIDGVSPTASK